jgi:hypothetical protein
VLFKTMNIQKRLKLNAAILLAAGTVGVASANPAQAALCSTITNISGGPTGLGAGNSCNTAGGWIFTLNSFSGFGATDALSFTGGGIITAPLTYGILQQAGSWTSANNPYTFNYSVTAPTPRLLSSYSSSLTSSVSGVEGGDAGTWDVNGTPGAAMAVFSTPTSTNGFKSYSTNLSSDTFSATLNVSTGQIQSVTSTINTREPSSAVPGPLPLLGAGAAFGFSRRLRNRVKLAA